MGFSYRTEQWLSYPVEDVFAFFANPDNLPLLMPEWQQARLEKTHIVPPPRSTAGPDSPGTAAGSGTRVMLSLRAFSFIPFRIRWVAEITDFAWNSQFCDRQVRGPFAHWEHTHRFRSIDRFGMNLTLVVDQVEYDLSFGILGKLAHRLFLRRRIERTFAFRQNQIATYFEQFKPQAPQAQPKSA